MTLRCSVMFSFGALHHFDNRFTTPFTLLLIFFRKPQHVFTLFKARFTAVAV